MLLPAAFGADSSSPVEPLPNRPLRAAFLIVNGVYNTELMAPWDVFQHTAYALAPGSGIEVFTVAASKEPITTAEGLRILPDYSFDTAPDADILIVASAQGSREEDRSDREVIEWVRRAGRQARFVMSLCWGAFILAEAGLLDGYACTTFPGDFDTFAEAFPDLDLKTGVSFVHDRTRLTSQGGVRSYEAAIYLVELLYGAPAARAVAGGLLIDWPPNLAEPLPYISDQQPTNGSGPKDR